MDTNPIRLVSLQVRRLVYTHAQSWKEETLGKAAPSVKERGLEKICYSQFLGVTHLPTPWLWRPVSRSVRQWMSAVWAAWVVGLCHGSLSNVMCGRQRYHWGCTGAGGVWRRGRMLQRRSSHVRKPRDPQGTPLWQVRGNIMGIHQATVATQ
jgi:hypothetical protein